MCVRAGLPVHEWPRLRWYSVSGVSGMGSHTREGPEGSSTSACTNTSKVRQPAAPSTPAAARAGQARRPTAVAAATVMPFLRNVRRLIISDFPPVWCAFPDYALPLDAGENQLPVGAGNLVLRLEPESVHPEREARLDALDGQHAREAQQLRHHVTLSLP